jgi:hypothetical protein
MDAEAWPGRGLFRLASIAVREYLLVLTSRARDGRFYFMLPVSYGMSIYIVLVCYVYWSVDLLPHFVRMMPFLWHKNARQSRNRVSFRNFGAAASSFGYLGFVIRTSSDVDTCTTVGPMPDVLGLDFIHVRPERRHQLLFCARAPDTTR